jgi:putative transcriptional regulator
MSKETGTKRNIFAELMEGVDAMGAHRAGKVTLRTHSLPEAEVRESPGAEFFVAAREKFNVSRAVWADMLRVSPRTVEKWEQGGQVSPLAATFVELVSRYPDTIDRLQTLPKRVSRTAEKPLPASPTITVRELFGAAGLPVFGPVSWNKTVNEGGPGVYVIATVVNPDESVSRVVPVNLPPVVASRWLSSQPVLYIGQTNRPLKTRVNEFYRHKHGARGPHKGGQVVKLLINCPLNVYWSPTERAVEAEKKMIEEFVVTTNRLPFGNLKYPSRSVGDSQPIQLSV